MGPDAKRIRTYLSYKGFQWEPLEEQDGVQSRPSDFHGCRQGKICFHGALISIGKERPLDGLPARVVIDEQERESLRKELSLKLRHCAQRFERRAAGFDMPRVVMIVNHEPSIGFEDLTALLDDPTSQNHFNIHLYVWFDDLRHDKMLFSRTDENIFSHLSDWFQED